MIVAVMIVEMQKADQSYKVLVKTHNTFLVTIQIYFFKWLLRIDIDSLHLALSQQISNQNNKKMWRATNFKTRIGLTHY